VIVKCNLLKAVLKSRRLRCSPTCNECCRSLGGNPSKTFTRPSFRRTLKSPRAISEQLRATTVFLEKFDIWPSLACTWRKFIAPGGSLAGAEGNNRRRDTWSFSLDPRFAQISLRYHSSIRSDDIFGRSLRDIRSSRASERSSRRRFKRI